MKERFTKKKPYNINLYIYVSLYYMEHNDDTIKTIKRQGKCMLANVHNALKPFKPSELSRETNKREEDEKKVICVYV